VHLAAFGVRHQRDAKAVRVVQLAHAGDDGRVPRVVRVREVLLFEGV
jgi:hypothetical protein